MAAIDTDLGRLVKDSMTITVRLTGVRRFTVRLRAALGLIRLAGLVCPIPIVVEADHEAGT